MPQDGRQYIRTGWEALVTCGTLLFRKNDDHSVPTFYLSEAAFQITRGGRYCDRMRRFRSGLLFLERMVPEPDFTEDDTYGLGEQQKKSKEDTEEEEEEEEEDAEGEEDGEEEEEGYHEVPAAAKKDERPQHEDEEAVNPSKLTGPRASLLLHYRLSFGSTPGPLPSHGHSHTRVQCLYIQKEGDHFTVRNVVYNGLKNDFSVPCPNQVPSHGPIDNVMWPWDQRTIIGRTGRHERRPDLEDGRSGDPRRSTSRMQSSQKSSCHTQSSSDIRSGLTYSNPSNSLWSIFSITRLRTEKVRTISLPNLG
ncbi:unnamed protein product [Nesidiocoris tenuis]|uniref:Uncharacterized protein n=1 Tax=Nesidiocoris tenuis TaxID=355587 RepID=A0A6H5GSD1_9HEMI|nr:unnamed protein product [Nesidiocoris tenuis]